MRPDEHAASTLGPVQVMVIGFEGHDFTGEILPELRRLEEQDIVSLVDLLFVEKDDDGEVRTVELSGLSAEERAEFGAIAGALTGLGAAGAEGLEAGALAGALAMGDGAFDEADICARLPTRFPPDPRRRSLCSNTVGPDLSETQLQEREGSRLPTRGYIRSISLPSDSRPPRAMCDG